MITIVVILSIILLVSLYVNINTYKKIEALEKQIDYLSTIESNSIELVKNLLVVYVKVLTKLKRIDRLGSFESDDEVGFVFKTIKTTIEELKLELDNLNKTLINEGNESNGVG